MNPVYSSRLVWGSRSQSHRVVWVTRTWSICGASWWYWACSDSRHSRVFFNALAASLMRRIYSGLELLLLDCILPRYVNSSTGSTVLLSNHDGQLWTFSKFEFIAIFQWNVVRFRWNFASWTRNSCDQNANLLNWRWRTDAILYKCVYIWRRIVKKSTANQRHAISYWWLILTVAVLLIVCQCAK